MVALAEYDGRGKLRRARTCIASHAPACCELLQRVGAGMQALHNAMCHDTSS